MLVIALLWGMNLNLAYSSHTFRSFYDYEQENNSQLTLNFNPLTMCFFDDQIRPGIVLHTKYPSIGESRSTVCRSYKVVQNGSAPSLLINRFVATVALEGKKRHKHLDLTVPSSKIKHIAIVGYGSS